MKNTRSPPPDSCTRVQQIIEPIAIRVRHIYGNDDWPINVPLHKLLTNLEILPPRLKHTRRRLHFICLCVQRALRHVLPAALQAHVVRYAARHPRHWEGQWEADERGEPCPTNKYCLLQGLPDESADESDEQYYDDCTKEHDTLIGCVLQSMKEADSHDSPAPPPSPPLSPSRRAILATYTRTQPPSKNTMPSYTVRNPNSYLTAKEKADVDKAESTRNDRILRKIYFGKKAVFTQYVKSTPGTRPFVEQWTNFACEYFSDARDVALRKEASEYVAACLSACGEKRDNNGTQAGMMTSGGSECGHDDSSSNDSESDWSRERIDREMEACTVPTDCPSSVLQTLFADAPVISPGDVMHGQHGQECDSDW